MHLPDIDYSTFTALLVTRGVRQLVIVGQDEAKLSTAAEELKSSASGLSIRILAADLTKRETPEDIKKAVEGFGWHVDLLVNNAGFGRKYVFGRNLKNDTSLAAVDLMVRAVVEMSLRFLPDMVQQRKGGVLNVGSTACYQPVPYSAIYGASKAFILSFSQSIREENIRQDTGVRFAQIIPSVTQTNLDGEGHGEKRGPIELVGVDQPEDVAKVAVDAFEENAAAKVVGWNNFAFHTAMNILPDSVKASLVSSSRGPPITQEA